MSVMGKWTSKAVCRLAGGAMDLALNRFPPLVRIETVNACNSRCAICRHSAMGRRMQQMDQGLFEQIVDECAVWGCRDIHLHNFGEPLLDDRLEDRVRYAKQKGIAKLTIFSNGSLLDESRAAGLIAAGLDEIKISFDGADKEEFERIRHPLKFDDVVENLARLKDLRDRLRSPMRILIACCSTSDKRSTERVLAGLIDGVRFSKMHNWTDAGSLNGQHGVRKPCVRLWRTLTVLASGDVALCCLDYDGQHLLGRVGPGISLRDVWQSPAYEEIRRRHKDARQGEIGLCRSCSKSYF
jgi:uncharacterized Fe-S cluster-containing radical SAM superfamily protein